MRLRRTSTGVRVFLLVLIPLLALIGVYSFAVAGELGTAVGLSNAAKVAGATITPTSELLVALIAERSLAVGYLGTGSGSGIVLSPPSMPPMCPALPTATVVDGRSPASQPEGDRARRRGTCSGGDQHSSPGGQTPR